MPLLSSSPSKHTTERVSSERRPRTGWIDQWAKYAVIKRLRDLQSGELELCDSGSHRTFGRPKFDEKAHVEVLDQRFFREIALGSSLGAGDAYVRGYWKSANLLAVMRLFAKELNQQEDLNTFALPLRALGRRLLQRTTRNSRSGSRRNIRRHYDLSNELFALFLDPTMTYSCGVFADSTDSLEAASLSKYELICQKLQLSADDHVVELGCGWGGFAEYAASHYGCRVTGVTISAEQLKFAKERIARAGLAPRVELRFCDYRDLEGSFDKLVSIEMIEAVGHEYLPTFFEKCNALLKPTGQMLLQAITIPDDRYDYYRRHVDFIQKYIFPGGCLPSLGVLASSASRASDLRITHVEDFAADYAQTLLLWRDKFHQSLDEIKQLGFDDVFIRTWDYYFAYCAAGFLERQIGVAQLLMKRPEAE